METEREVLAHYFADEWLMVTENTYEQFEELMNDAKEAESMVSLSSKLQEEWERLAEQVSDLVEEQISETASLYVRQLLQGWGSYPFDIIARRALEKKAEIFSPDNDDVETVAWSSSNPTGERLSNV